MCPETFVTFQKRVEAILGPDAKAIFYEAGITAGQSAINAKLQISEKRGLELLKQWVEVESSLEQEWGKFKDLKLI